jgi:hypothetical protein
MVIRNETVVFVQEAEGAGSEGGADGDGSTFTHMGAALAAQRRSERLDFLTAHSFRVVSGSPVSRLLTTVGGSVS